MQMSQDPVPLVSCGYIHPLSLSAVGADPYTLLAGGTLQLATIFDPGGLTQPGRLRYS
jgi:hypothetical protein